MVALRFIEYGEEMAEIVRWLIKRLKSLKFRIRRVFLDKGFCSKLVFKVLGPAQIELWRAHSRTRQVGWSTVIVSRQVPRNNLYLQQPETWSDTQFKLWL